MLSYILEKTKCMFIMSVKPFIKIGKCMVHGSGVQILGRGQGGHIIKLKWFYIVFFTIINCCHVHNILMLDSKIPRPYGRRWGVREGKGGGIMTIFWICIFIYGNCCLSPIDNFNVILKTTWLIVTWQYWIVMCSF